MTGAGEHFGTIRSRLRAARHNLAAAALSGDLRGQRTAAGAVLAAIRAAQGFTRSPSARTRDEWALWRVFALAVLRHGTPPPGLLARARHLVEVGAINPNEIGDTHYH